jgi:hypothetical protein
MVKGRHNPSFRENRLDVPPGQYGVVFSDLDSHLAL